MPKFLAYVDVPVVTMERTAMLVEDMKDLDEQLTIRQHHLISHMPEPRASKKNADKQGKPVLYPLGPDWST